MNTSVKDYHGNYSFVFLRLAHSLLSGINELRAFAALSTLNSDIKQQQITGIASKLYFKGKFLQVANCVPQGKEKVAVVTESIPCKILTLACTCCIVP